MNHFHNLDRTAVLINGCLSCKVLKFCLDKIKNSNYNMSILKNDKFAVVKWTSKAHVQTEDSHVIDPKLLNGALGDSLNFYFRLEFVLIWKQPPSFWDVQVTPVILQNADCCFHFPLSSPSRPFPNWITVRFSFMSDAPWDSLVYTAVDSSICQVPTDRQWAESSIKEPPSHRRPTLVAVLLCAKHVCYQIQMAPFQQ